MITEIADFSIHPEQHAEFGVAIARALKETLTKAEGYLGHEVLACIETPGRYILRVRWANVEAHMVGFRQSPAFADWRAIIAPFFKAPPHMEHFTTTDQS